jgi:adenylate cyclase, class 2
MSQRVRNLQVVNFEFKAVLRDEARPVAVLKKLRALFIGRDRQIDTYFHVPRGRLKVREGNMESALVYYQRENAARARRADVSLQVLPPDNSTKALLARALVVLTVVDKQRKIYFVGNVKIHLDQVKGLGAFWEVEAISRNGNIPKVRAQALKFQKLLGVTAADIVPESYSDLALSKISAGKKSRTPQRPAPS